MSYAAAVVEVVVNDKGDLTIMCVDVAFDCGPQVNPERIRSQLEGAVLMGASLATLGEITFKNGRVEQNNFDAFQVTRINAAPREIRVHLLPASDWSLPLGGVGEPGFPPIAPPCVMPFLQPPVNGSASCRLAISLRGREATGPLDASLSKLVVVIVSI